MIDFYKLLSEHTLLFALGFIIVFIFIRFYLWPKIRDSNGQIVETNKPFDLEQYDNTRSLK